MDKLDKISRISELLTQRFGESTPFMIVTRLAEEVGELAKEVNHFEASGVKSQKMGAPNKERLVKEAQDVIRTVLQLVQKYEVQAEFEKSIDDAHSWFENKYRNS